MVHNCSLPVAGAGTLNWLASAVRQLQREVKSLQQLKAHAFARTSVSHEDVLQQDPLVIFLADHIDLPTGVLNPDAAPFHPEVVGPSMLKQNVSKSNYEPQGNNTHSIDLDAYRPHAQEFLPAVGARASSSEGDPAKFCRCDSVETGTALGDACDNTCDEIAADPTSVLCSLVTAMLDDMDNVVPLSDADYGTVCCAGLGVLSAVDPRVPMDTFLHTLAGSCASSWRKSSTDLHCADSDSGSDVGSSLPEASSSTVAECVLSSQAIQLWSMLPVGCQTVPDGVENNNFVSTFAVVFELSFSKIGSMSMEHCAVVAMLCQKLLYGNWAWLQEKLDSTDCREVVLRSCADRVADLYADELLE